METNLRKRENIWISTGKNRGPGEKPKEKRKRTGLVQVKTGLGVLNLSKRENKWISTGKKQRWGDQSKEKRKQMN